MSDFPKILIVDDKAANLMAMEGLLEEVGANLLTASSGHEALALMLKHEFALVLLDVQMPDMDGFETAALMRGMKQTRHLPIIFVTAINKEDEHIFRGYDAGAIDYLFKPINPVILRSKVEVFLKIYRQQRLLEKKTIDLDQKVEELLVLKAQMEETNQQLEEANQQLEALSRTDSLTGLANRRQFKEVLAAEWRRALRNGNSLALIMADIDAFKAFNDTYGHLAGDDCLRTIALALRSPLMRPSDLAARFGGEEFVILLPGTDLEGGAFIAEEIRQDVEKLAITHAGSDTGGLVTMSFGVTAVQPSVELVDLNLVCTADKALYMAKKEGKNRCVAMPLEEDSDCLTNPEP
ncbi:MAG TPA: diguanylate cyclase response regulator [Desulfobulbaceae bacterium]|nr:MAG: diguanylate cyclase response regulator [Deltaproteobacteria bacterium RIFOXYD12_FULL_53_23]HCC54466.1 diguanylate cyclase response regulator [Desulfobulbaceae bacterium]